MSGDRVMEAERGHPLDGVRPRNAVCVKCGYRFGGVPIRGGMIVCPECGSASRFELAGARENAGLRTTVWWLRVAAWAGVVAIIVVVVAAAV